MHTSIRVQRRQSGLPFTVVYGLLRALPGDRALLPPSPAELSSANLTPASGCQDHTTWPSAWALFVNSAAASTTSRPASVTIAIRPSVGRDSDGYKTDLGQNKTGIFFREGLDRNLLICPSGKISRP